jgi:hypothetical protein
VHFRGIIPTRPQGRKKTLSTQGYACNNRKCAYYRVKDERVHALVGYGHHGKKERIQDLMCQACGEKFTVRRDTVLYRLKSHSGKVALSLALLAEGMDVSAVERGRFWMQKPIVPFGLSGKKTVQPLSIAGGSASPTHVIDLGQPRRPSYP